MRSHPVMLICNYFQAQCLPLHDGICILMPGLGLVKDNPCSEMQFKSCRADFSFNNVKTPLNSLGFFYNT